MQEEIIPDFTHDARGQVVRISEAACKALADMIAEDAAYIYTPAGDQHFWQVWLNHEIDAATGYAGVRVPLAEWVRAYEAQHNDAA